MSRNDVGVTFVTIPLPMLTEKHLRTAVQAMAYLVAFSEVTKQPSAFDAEREESLAVIRDNASDIIAACNSHASLLAENKALREALNKIAVGEGYYGEQAREYKQIARAALGETR